MKNDINNLKYIYSYVCMCINYNINAYNVFKKKIVTILFV